MIPYRINEEANFALLKDGSICVELKKKLIKIKNKDQVTIIEKLLNNKYINQDYDNLFKSELLKYNILTNLQKKHFKRVEFFEMINSNEEMKYIKICSNDKNWKNIIQEQSKERYIVFIGTIYDYNFLEQVNKYCKELRRNIINVIMFDSEEIVINNIINSIPIRGCFNCFTRRLCMNSVFINEKINMAKDLVNFRYIKTKIEFSSKLQSLILDQILKLINLNTLEVISIEKNDLWEVKEEGCLIELPDCCECNSIKVVEKEKLPIIKAVNSKVGIIKSYNIQKETNLNNDFYVAISKSTDFSVLNKHLKIICNSGAGFSEEIAVNAAIGETLERYSAAMIDNNIIVSSYNKLIEEGMNAINPEEFELFSREQYANYEFPYKPFDKNTIVGWSKCRELLSDEIVWAPACFIYLPYLKKKNETLITPYISTGLAANVDYESAVLSGIYEIIERDAFSISWLKKIPPIQLSMEQQIVTTDKLKCRSYELTLDIEIPTVVCIAEGEINGKNVLSVGAASRYKLSDAIKKAHIEAIQGRQYVYDLTEYFNKVKLEKGFENIDTFQKHAMFYTKFPELKKEVRYLLDEDSIKFRKKKIRKEQEFKSLKDKLSHIVKLINNCGYKIYVKDITPSDLQRFNISVVRVIIPGLHGLHGTHKYRYLSSLRMDKINQVFNGNNNVLNQFPHPFP
ncbi:YcaO-like family protein [Clostridium perfringens]|uniref:YcaO-like family protein n=1 Tax=Clostridium perfringens TaxID=1502 RepID=UPI0015E42741|nr:YcaO-like family protein [Clostridium perfringens]